ncbi:MAG: hypothetical protein E7373_03670 [Clostridiales bacterium]|nr:hypothetical protein [Clostridiales bacterium]
MQEIFYEESAKIQNEKSATIKYRLFQIFSIISYVLLVGWILFGILPYTPSGNVLLDILFLVIPLVMFFCSGFFLGRLKNKFYVDYDYTFVSGSIRFSKVIKNINRKFIIKFDSHEIEKLGKYGSETFEKYSQMPGISKSILTSNYTPSEGKAFYYLIANTAGDKKLFIIECSETFIFNIMKFANKSILDEEFVKEIVQSKKNKAQ